MTGFELRTSGIVSNRSTNWATTTALLLTFLDNLLFPFLAVFLLT